MSRTYLGTIAHFIENQLPELLNKKEIYQQIWRELHARGLVNIDVDGLNTVMTGQGK